ncbi:hypothetical protein, partial [Thiolapillus sp.]|uniref:hypothetical protein n=1 Tax=Thiolapillus sp. TaxID=2017437 RepID=UPI003AF7AF6E
IHRIAQAYHRWRETVFSDGGAYEDIPGFCYSADLKGIEKHRILCKLQSPQKPPTITGYPQRNIVNLST